MSLKQAVLRNLVNMGNASDNSINPKAVAAFLASLNRLSVQMGRVADANCTICLDALDADVYVVPCGHQSNLTCLGTWWNTRRNRECPLCKK